MHRLAAAVPLSLILLACNPGQGGATQGDETDAPLAAITPVDIQPFTISEVTEFEEPWAMTFMPDGEMLVSEKAGKLFITKQTGEKTEVKGVPKVDYGGQGGFGDVILSPDFATDSMVYLSWVEAGKDDTRGAVVGRAKLVLGEDGAKAAPELTDLEIIWTQFPKVTGRGHFSHRLAFSPDGKHLFISSGERQKFDPSQDMKANLGKIVRLYPDGSVPEDNPFYDQGGIAAQIWSLGHRNLLGLAFDEQGRLWNSEMGPLHGDELNLVKRGANYGYPIVSNGDHYSGEEIPDHDTRPEFATPAAYWVPTIAPSGLTFYDGEAFPEWKNSFFIGGLAGEAIVRVTIDGESAKEAERYEMGARIREVEQAADGSLWVLQDGEKAKLLKLSPTG